MMFLRPSNCCKISLQSTVPFLAILALLWLCPPVQAAFDAFLKIDGITGESTDLAHENWIEVLSMSAGMARSSVPGTDATDFQELSILKVYDKASPILYRSCAAGDPIVSATLEVRESTGTHQVFLRWVFEDLLVSSIRPGGIGKGEEERPLEEVTFSYQRIRWEYLPPGGGEPVITTWDIGSGTPILKERQP